MSILTQKVRYIKVVATMIRQLANRKKCQFCAGWQKGRKILSANARQIGKNLKNLYSRTGINSVIGQIGYIYIYPFANANLPARSCEEQGKENKRKLEVART